MGWKAIVLLAWNAGIKKALAKLSERTDNKWDDAAVDMVDQVVNKVLN